MYFIQADIQYRPDYYITYKKDIDINKGSKYDIQATEYP